MRVRLFLTALSLLPLPAQAIAPQSVTYYCTSEAAGGLKYDEQLKKWRSINFRTGKAFVLKLQFLSASKEKMFDFEPSPTTVNQFRVTVTEAGSSKEKNCINMNDPKAPVRVWGDGWVRCETVFTEYRAG